MKRTTIWSVGLAAVTALAFSGCTSSSPTAAPSQSTPTEMPTPTAVPTQAPVTLTMAAWSLSSTPEFKTLTEAFTKANPSITIQLKEYKAGNDYDTQMIADLAAGVAPDLYILKNLNNVFTYQDGKQLMDVSDVAAGYDSKTSGLPFYKVGGKTWAIPYRQDSWYLFYDKDMFDKAGVAIPDGKWTWDDYAAAAGKLSKGLGGGDVYGAYQHRWQSTVQGFATAQTPGASILGGDVSYMKPYYDRVVAMQDSGAQVKFATSSTNSLTYQSQFGKQKAAMLIMGSWYVASYLAQVGTGDAVKFNWGVAPVPQRDSSTVSNPVTFGDPTGIGINPAIEKSKVDAAKKFLAFIGGQDAAVALASIGIVPAYTSDAVTTAFFALKGVPTDTLSKFTFGTHDTRPENQVDAKNPKIQAILNDMNTSIMSGSSTVDAAITKAQSRIKAEVLKQ
jgi:multiple sugar transport system substrate-binding protein